MEIEDIYILEARLGSILADLGGIPESNSHYSFRFAQAVARKMEDDGKEIEDLTLGEIMAIDRAERRRYHEDFCPGNPLAEVAL